MTTSHTDGPFETLVKQADRKVNDQLKSARSNIPIRRYFEFKRATQARKYHILAEVADIPEVRDHFLQAARRQEELDAQLTLERQALEQQSAPIDTELAASIIEKAYQKGPNFSAFLRGLFSWLDSYWSPLAPFFTTRQISKIARGLYDYAPLVVFSVLLGSLIYNSWVLVPTGFLLQEVFQTILLALIACIMVVLRPNLKNFFPFDGEKEKATFHKRCLAVSGVVLAFTIFTTQFFWLGPDSSYTVLEIQSGKIIRVIPNQWFIRPPSKNSTVVWYMVESGLLQSSSVCKVKGLAGTLRVSYRLNFREDNISNLNGASPDQQKQELFAKISDSVNNIITRSGDNNVDLGEVMSQVGAISNDAYQVNVAAIWFEPDYFTIAQ